MCGKHLRSGQFFQCYSSGPPQWPDITPLKWCVWNIYIKTDHSFRGFKNGLTVKLFLCGTLTYITLCISFLFFCQNVDWWSSLWCSLACTVAFTTCSVGGLLCQIKIQCCQPKYYCWSGVGWSRVRGSATARPQVWVWFSTTVEQAFQVCEYWAESVYRFMIFCLFFFCPRSWPTSVAFTPNSAATKRRTSRRLRRRVR